MIIKQLIVDHSHWWGKWPDTDDADYRDVCTSSRAGFGDDIVVESAVYPICSAWPPHLRGTIPHGYPCVDNTVEPPAEVMQRMLIDLSRASKEYPVLFWRHAWQCFVPVAEQIKKLFKWSAIWHNDDAPGSSEKKTFPVARYFDAMVHAVDVWDMGSGERTADKYRALGVEHTFLMGPSPCVSPAYSVSDKIGRIRSGDMPPVVLCWVGNGNGCTDFRRSHMDALNGQAFGFPTRIHGHCMRDGVLQPWDTSPGDRAAAVADLYMNSAFGVNVQENSLLNSRLVDLWLCGVAQICHDPWNELEKYAGLFLPWDGDAASLEPLIRRALSNPSELADMLDRARQVALCSKWGRSAIEEPIIRDYILPRLR